MPSDFQLVIDGRLVEAADGGTFETVDPSTGQVHATVARADAQDVGRAVRAARAAFDDGRWSGLKPERRAEVLARIAPACCATTPRAWSIPRRASPRRRSSARCWP